VGGLKNDFLVNQASDKKEKGGVKKSVGASRVSKMAFHVKKSMNRKCIGNIKNTRGRNEDVENDCVGGTGGGIPRA